MSRVLRRDCEYPLAGEPTGEFRQDRQVGVQPDPLNPTGRAAGGMPNAGSINRKYAMRRDER
jgi:hypothetical protein